MLVHPKTLLFDVGETDVVVIGAGQAGLSSAYFLRRAGMDFTVLDANPAPGGAWQHRWPTLRMATVHGIFDLPGMKFDPPSPREPAATAVPAYFAAYEREFGLEVHRPVAVSAVRPGPRLSVDSTEGTWSARAVINATGTWTHPFWPHYPGEFHGRQLHTAGYRGPGEFAGKRVLVVGGGTSAVQLQLEIATVAETFWVTRREPVFRAGPFTHEYGREIIARVDERVRAGLSPESVVSATDLGLTPEVVEARHRGLLARRPMFDRLVPTGVAWADGATLDVDVILWCTGWRAALEHLAPLGLRGPGGGIVMDGTRVVTEPRVHLVGYGPSASTVGANRAGRTAVREIRHLLGEASAYA
ncbi:pyridine nucleotide-disulfide oxidoreductase [Actinophytocola oryzae]|uniref:Pyridine nucleotide-disulfide oxidoreductase n=1 Tax=Actinophytocola oryzae TaxID=502181 RepID=A0A4R7VVN6_9PSEU|nr:pyridine nucleotide-disulfide oxidoreductase [Actinophytocola oryzae]